MRGVFEPTRRTVVQGGAALAAGVLARCAPKAETAARPTGRLAETRLNGSERVLTAAERPITLPGASGPTPAWLYEAEPFPVLRVAAGGNVNITLANSLKEHSSIHWHGIRVPNAMDGVPYLTQLPVLPGERFSYRFTPPDPGLFIFHPHCNTVEQFGRGLSGVMIVAGDESDSFDDDIICVLKDWRVARDGAWLPFMTAEGAGRAGTFGTLRTTNAQAAPEISVPAGADIRLRVVNLDSTRIGAIGVEGAEAHIIAIDGNALAPFTSDGWRLGPAMRVEYALRTPADGGKVRLVDYFAAEPVALATLMARGPSKHNDPFVAHSLKPAAFPEPDLGHASTHALTLGSSAAATDYAALPPIVLPDGRKIDLLDTLCSTAGTFWAIDGKTWPQQGHQHLPPPLMRFKRGETALIEFSNTSKNAHPMHLHGHAFKVLSCSKLERPVHWADTVLVMPDERVRIAFVADNPGNWMIHCHIIEHQDTGMMAWFEVA